MTLESRARDALRDQATVTSEAVAEVLARRGFQSVVGEVGIWRGTVQTSVGRTMIDVTLPVDFPFVKPRVRPLTQQEAEAHTGRELPNYRDAGWGWHRETQDGQLCLFEDADHVDLPWADGEALYDQLVAWLEQDAAGWPSDGLALDLERYLPRSGEMLIHDDLVGHIGSVVRLDRRKGLLHVGRPIHPRRGSRGVRRSWPRASALVVDIGEAVAPVRGWSDLLDAAGDARKLVEQEVELGVDHLIVLYQRGGYQGVLALGVARQNGEVSLEAHDAASISPAAMSRRGHPDHTRLASSTVAVVGVGAVGSVVVDLLHRSGVRNITVMDLDRVKPGNVIRHLAPMTTIGFSKPEAVKRTLEASRPGTTASISAMPASLGSSVEAVSVLTDHDVVVDATADSTASVLLAAAARVGAGVLVSVAVLADGYAIRVDHVPVPAGRALPELDLPPVQPGFLEAGCSSPVSTTPAAAAWEAAAIACRHVIHTLLGDAADCPGEQRVLRPGERT